jgi:hypothetical protein
MLGTGNLATGAAFGGAALRFFGSAASWPTPFFHQASEPAGGDSLLIQLHQSLYLLAGLRGWFAQEMEVERLSVQQWLYLQQHVAG